MVLMSAAVQLYFICLFNSAQLKGDKLVLLMSFAFLEASGVFASGQITKFLSVKRTILSLMFIVVVLNAAIKFANPSES